MAFRVIADCPVTELTFTRWLSFEAARDYLVGVLYIRAACEPREWEKVNYRTMANDVCHWLSPQWCHVDNKRFDITEEN